MYRPHLTAWVPRYGTVRSLVLYGLVVVVTWRAGPELRETLATTMGTTPASAGRVLAILLWLLLAVILGFEFRRQTRPFPSFLTPDVRAKFLEQRVPTRILFSGYIALLAAGGYIALFARNSFFVRIDGALLVVRRLLATGDPGAFSLSAVGYGVLFIIGAVSVAHAADRVLVACVRAFIAREQ